METHSYFPSFSQEIPPEIAPHIIGWARVPPAKAYNYPGAPAYWCAVLALDPTQPDRKAIEWYFGKSRQCLTMDARPADPSCHQFCPSLSTGFHRVGILRLVQTPTAGDFSLFAGP